MSTAEQMRALVQEIVDEAKKKGVSEADCWEALRSDWRPPPGKWETPEIPDTANQGTAADPATEKANAAADPEAVENLPVQPNTSIDVDYDQLMFGLEPDALNGYPFNAQGLAKLKQDKQAEYKGLIGSLDEFNQAYNAVYKQAGMQPPDSLPRLNADTTPEQLARAFEEFRKRVRVTEYGEIMLVAKKDSETKPLAVIMRNADWWNGGSFYIKEWSEIGGNTGGAGWVDRMLPFNEFQAYEIDAGKEGNEVSLNVLRGLLSVQRSRPTHFQQELREAAGEYNRKAKGDADRTNRTPYAGLIGWNTFNEDKIEGKPVVINPREQNIERTQEEAPRRAQPVGPTSSFERVSLLQGQYQSKFGSALTVMEYTEQGIWINDLLGGHARNFKSEASWLAERGFEFKQERNGGRILLRYKDPPASKIDSGLRDLAAWYKSTFQDDLKIIGVDLNSSVINIEDHRGVSGGNLLKPKFGGEHYRRLQKPESLAKLKELGFELFSNRESSTLQLRYVGLSRS